MIFASEIVDPCDYARLPLLLPLQTSMTLQSADDGDSLAM
jgi:hypothetical protein